MLGADLRFVEAAEHHVRVVPELARCVHTLLHVCVLTAELLDLFLDSILHEMLACLALAHHGALAADWIQLVVLVVQSVRGDAL